MKITQLVVRLDKTGEAFEWLEGKGFDNVQSLKIDNYFFPVIVIDTVKKCFFGTNTTCMAAMKPKVIEFSELEILLK